ncbi:MAG: GspH/FimT family pseudopilin [Pseudomonadaceae bacterium]|nr:GspH/FimT family pseudopilin [Pseudomonadaceae bacterium]
MTKVYGHTLLELIVCLLICGILLSVAAPPLGAALQSNQQTQLLNQLVGTLNYARGSAVLDRNTVAICSGRTHCLSTTNWSNQLLIFNDQNQNGQMEAEERLLRTEVISENYIWNWSNLRHRSYLQFEQNGSPRALNGTLTLCRAGQPLKQIVINVTGRMRTQSPSATARCS